LHGVPRSHTSVPATCRLFAALNNGRRETPPASHLASAGQTANRQTARQTPGQARSPAEDTAI
jgi:hypothetical protein